LVIRVLQDSATLSGRLKWAARIAAPLSAVFVSGGFFGLAFALSFVGPLYLGGGLLITALLHFASVQADILKELK